MPVLVICKMDYADEYEVFGFQIFPSKENWERFLADAKEYFEKKQKQCVENYIRKNGKEPGKYTSFALATFSFGSNQDFMIESFDEFYRAFEVKEITEEEEKIINNAFDKYSRGYTQMMEKDFMSD